MELIRFEQVLGFTPGEVRFYVLRENLVLSFIAGLLGIPLGILSRGRFGILSG